MVSLLKVGTSSESQRCYNIKSFSSTIFKQFDARNGVVDAGRVRMEFHVTIDAPGADELAIYSCFIRSEPFSGEIELDSSLLSIHDGSMESRVMRFDGASIYSLEEDYDLDNSGQRLVHVKFVADHAEFDSVEFFSYRYYENNQ
ncbi:MAG: hypothetical protein SNG35_00895 [Rikenellaceae bacterium]